MIVQIKKTDVNGTPIPTPTAPAKRVPRKQRDIVNEACDLRIYIADRLRTQCLELGLKEDQYSCGAVTAVCIAMEKQGITGIPADVFETIMQKGA